MAPIKSYESEKIYKLLKKALNTPKTSNNLSEYYGNRTVEFSNFYVQNKEFRIFLPEEKIKDACLFVFFSFVFFFRDDCIELEIVQDWKRAYLIGNKKF